MIVKVSPTSVRYCSKRAAGLYHLVLDGFQTNSASYPPGRVKPQVHVESLAIAQGKVIVAPISHLYTSRYAIPGLRRPMFLSHRVPYLVSSQAYQ